MRVRKRDWANKNAEFAQLVSAMRLSLGECLKFVENVPLIYLKSVSNEVSDLSEKITSVEMH